MRTTFLAGTASFWLMIVPAGAFQDANENGMSDIFEKAFNAGGLFSSSDPSHAPEADPDGDGFSNAKEAIAGTNPFDATLPEGWVQTTIERNAVNAALFTVSFPSIEGKFYQLTSSSDLVQWIDHPEVLDGTGTVIQFPIDASLEDSDEVPERLFWRVKISDADEDLDNLTNWEEHVLGSNPQLEDTDHDGRRDDTDSNPLVNLFSSDPDGEGIPAGLRTGLIGRWDFETLAPRPNFSDLLWGNARFLDSTPNARHGGTISVGQEPLGMPSKGADLQRGFIGIPPSLLSNRAVYSVSLWAKLPPDAIASGKTHAALFSNHTYQTVGNGARRYVNALYVTNENGVETLRAGGYIYNSATSYQNITGVAVADEPGTWTDNKWHHYLYVCNDAVVALYLDGELMGQTSYTPADISTDSNLSGVSVGRFYGPAMGTVPQSTAAFGILKGQVDRLRVWSRALSAEDAVDLYKEDVSGDGIDDRTSVASRFWQDQDFDGVRDPNEYTYVFNPFFDYSGGGSGQ